MNWKACKFHLPWHTSSVKDYYDINFNVIITYDFTLIKNYLLFTDEQAIMTQPYCNNISVVKNSNLVIYEKHFYKKTSKETTQFYTQPFRNWPQSLLLSNSNKILTFLWYSLTFVKLAILLTLCSTDHLILTNKTRKHNRIFCSQLIFHQSVHWSKPVMFWDQQVTVMY